MSHDLDDRCAASGAGGWSDLSGLLLPSSEVERVIEKIKLGIISTVNDLTEVFVAYNDMYGEYLWTFTVSLIKYYLGKDELTEEDFELMRERGKAAREAWLDEIRRDAEKEFSMGDVDRATLDKFLAQLS